MSIIQQIVGQYLRLTERSAVVCALVYGLTAFAVILGIDFLGHFFIRWSWLSEDLTTDFLEASLLGITAAYLTKKREERIIRRHRQVQYLNHHVRNALTLIALVEHQLQRDQATAVHNASQRIRAVIEQLSRDEDVSIDEQAPHKIIQPDKATHN
jgi:hypothetical protein